MLHSGMSCCGGGTDEASKRSREVDRQLRADNRQRQEEIKLLLLGAGESGKSTFAKQMKILHLNGFDAAERTLFRTIIRKNILQSFETVLRACDQLGISVQTENEHLASKYSRSGIDNFTFSDVNDLKVLWRDTGVQEAVSRAHEFQYFDSTEYFMEHIERIGADSYIPTDPDILRSRSQTCGIVETKFSVGGLGFRMCDVAGQRSERRKWMQCFQDVKAVLVIVGISEFDQVLREQSEVNRMHEALKLFGDICNSRWFEKTTIILFLNKMDLFAEKIKRVPLTTCFPHYTGANNFEECTKFISDQFQSVNKNTNKLIYTHLTCATDTENITLIFEDVKNAILQDRLSDF